MSLAIGIAPFFKLSHGFEKDVFAHFVVERLVRIWGSGPSQKSRSGEERGIVKVKEPGEYLHVCSFFKLPAPGIYIQTLRG